MNKMITWKNKPIKCCLFNCTSCVESNSNLHPCMCNKQWISDLNFSVFGTILNDLSDLWLDSIPMYQKLPVINQIIVSDNISNSRRNLSWQNFLKLLCLLNSLLIMHARYRLWIPYQQPTCPIVFACSMHGRSRRATREKL